MADTKTKMPTARSLRAVEALKATGPTNGRRLADSPDLSDSDLRRLAEHAGDDLKLHGAAWKALRLRAKSRAGADIEESSTPDLGVGSLPDLRPGDAIVHRLDDDHVLVLGNTDVGLQFGDHVRDLSPALVSRAADAVGTMYAATTTGLQAASAVQSINQAGAVFVVTKAYRPLLEFPLAMARDGALGWVRPGGSGIAQLRFERAGTGLRSLSSVTGLVFTLAVIAGQARMDRTLGQICSVLDDVKEMERDQQVTEVLVAGRKVTKVLVAAERAGELSAGLLQLLPDRQQLEENVDRHAREVGRLQRRLDALPGKASEKLKVLQATAPDILLGMGLYAEAERTLSAVEAIHRYTMEQSGDVAVPALTQIEAAERQERLAAGAQLAADLDAAMASVDASPGSGWFSDDKRAKVRDIARQVRSDLPTLAPTSLMSGSVA